MGMSVMSDVTLVPQKSDIWWVFLLQGFCRNHYRPDAHY
jgi:hypothetical protein